MAKKLKVEKDPERNLAYAVVPDALADDAKRALGDDVFRIRLGHGESILIGTIR